VRNGLADVSVCAMKLLGVQSHRSLEHSSRRARIGGRSRRPEPKCWLQADFFSQGSRGNKSGIWQAGSPTLQPPPLHSGTLSRWIEPFRLQLETGSASIPVCSISFSTRVGAHQSHRRLSLEEQEADPGKIPDSSGFGAREGFQKYQNAFDPNANYSNGNFDIRNMFKGQVIYELPFGRGHQFLNNNLLLDEVLGRMAGFQCLRHRGRQPHGHHHGRQ
jgi:hypothetical protein